MSLAVGIVGCGLIGSRRAKTAVACGDRVVLVADILRDRAQNVASASGAREADSWQALASSPEVDAVVVATVNSLAPQVVSLALEAGKHVFCEKPFGTSAEEAAGLLHAAREAESVVKVGFTLRHHEAIARARRLVVAGEIGTVVAMRAAYGHGGRRGYENEWRGDPALAGGGELLDQGVHLLDLARWFLGEFVEVSGTVATWAWPVEPLEDNAFALLRTRDGRVASIHTSWSQWKNLFRLELLGTKGLIVVEGLGGSYGAETLSCATRRPSGGVPDQWAWTVPEPERAWADEWADFTAAVRGRGSALTTAEDGYEAARLVDAVYASARENSIIRLEEITAQ